MKPALIMAEDVTVVDNRIDETSGAGVGVGAEILKTVAAGGASDKKWSYPFATVAESCSTPLKCYNRKSPRSIFLQSMTDKNFNTTTFNAMNGEAGLETSRSDHFVNGAASVFSSKSEFVSAKHASGAVTDRTGMKSTKFLEQKLHTPVKLMRTPSAVFTRKRSSSNGPRIGEKRLDEELEELDEHLMSTTLKNIKFLPGPKFTIFNDVAFQRECLESHNKVRQLYGCPPLAWCQELADEAETWAQVNADRGRILYKELPGIGENISLITANGSNHLPTGTEVTELWASEAKHYNFARPTWSQKCQHFTQLVWKRTTEIGVARVWVPSKSIVGIVAFYAPSGNCNGINEFRDNVPKLSDDKQLPSVLAKK